MNPYYEKLIDSLISENYLKTPEIIEAFKNIDRADFVLDEYKEDAYVNAPLPIGFGQTISQPLTVAFMLELLKPRVGEKILDVGAGSGWQTAIISYLAGNARIDAEQTRTNAENLLVIGIERIPELKEFGEKNIAKYNFIEKGITRIILGNGSKGYKKEAPYDKIIAAAAAIGDAPKAWKQQLKIGGKIVAPIGNSIVVIEKTGKNKYTRKEHFGFSFVPLIENNKNK